MDVPIPCACPDGRHPEGDTVTLRDRLDFRAATTIRKAIAFAREEGRVDPAEILALMTEWYCLLGIESWSLTDEKGKPLPVTRTAIRERVLENAAFDPTDIADAADGLYMEAVLLPLVVRASASSPTGPTAGSTSRPKGSTAKPRTPSSRSSTTSTPTAVTGRTSPRPDGGSSTSPSSASAA